MDSLSAMSLFVRVAASGGHAEAGRVLGMPAAAVGLAVAEMEARLAVPLFEPDASPEPGALAAPGAALRLTPAGALFLERCRRILGNIEAAEGELLHASCAPCGKLRVNLPPLPGLLMPALDGFLRRYPDIELELDWSGRGDDVVGEGYDVVLRDAELRDPRLLSRRLGSYAQVLVAAPAYLARRGLPRTPADLAAHACLRHKSPASGQLERWPLRRDRETPGPALALPETVVSNTVEAVHYLALHGQGIAYLPTCVVGEALASGALRTVLDDYVDHSVTFWVMWPAERNGAAKARVFIDYLDEVLCSG